MAYWYSVSLLDVEDKVLDEGHLIQREDDLHTSCRHLRQDEQVERDGIDLEMTPGKVTNHS